MIIAMGVFPPVVSSADEIETDPTEAMYDAAPVNTVDFADVDESEEAESEVTGLEYETPDEGITDDPDDNTTDEDVPDDSDDTTGEDITDNTDDTTDEDVPDDPDDTTGEDITDNTDDTTDEDVPDDPDDTTGEDITDNTDDTTDEDVPDDSDDTTGEDITDNTDDTIDESITDEDIANDPDDETSDEIIIDDVGTEEEPEQDEEQSWTTFFEALSEKAAATAEILGIFTESEEVKTALETLTGAVLKITEQAFEDISELFVNYYGEEIQNYAAFDLGFYFGDEEVEPGTEVAVTVDLTEYLADQDYTPESLVLYHHVEDEWGEIVDTVEVASYEDGSITVDEETGTVTATFVVDSFSNFTITWSSENNTTYFVVTVRYWDATNNKEIDGIDATNITTTSTATYTFSDSEFAKDVAGYTYSGAHLGSVNGDEVTSVSFAGGRRTPRTATFNNGDGNNSEVAKYESGADTIPDVYLVYEVEKPLVFETVEADPAPGVSVTMYNYSGEINNHGISSTDNYTFYNYQSNSVDGEGNTSNGYGYWSEDKRLPLKRLLTSDGYPDTELHDNDTNVDGTLSYLFDDNVIGDGTDTDSADGKVVYDTMSDGGGLFQKEKDASGNWTGYYVYDSQKNAAYFKSPKDGFVLYKDTIIRPSAQSSDGTDRISDGNFLPFNELRTDTVSTSNVYTYDGSVKAYQLKAPVDLWFGMVIEFEFLMPKGGMVNENPMIFDFHGDDDVMVYIDNRLVLDISGTHQAESGSINFANSTYSVTNMDKETSSGTFFEIFEPKTDAEKELYNEDGSFKDYTVHKLKFFYLERGGSISYCRLRFNMPTLPEKSLTVKKELTDNNGANADVVGFVKDSLEYKFRVVKEDSTNELFIPEGTDYNLLENDVLIGTGEVGHDGYFTLKADQSAQFENVFQYSNNANIKYIVQEVMPDNLTGQYNNVGYAVGGGTNSETNIDTETTTDFTAFSTGALPADNSQIVIYRNQVAVEKLSVLKVAKEVLPGSNFADGQKFKFKVELGGEPLEAGTDYKIGDTTYKSEEDGYIYLADGETATIVKGILAGTEYTVTEVDGAVSNADYEVSCVHRVEEENDDGYKDVVCDALHHVVKDSSKENNTNGSVSGEIAVNSTVTVTVTNSSYDFGVAIPVTKQFIGNSAVDVPFTFTLTQCDKDGNPESNEPLLTKVIAVTGENVSEDKFFIGYTSSEVYEGDVYYLIKEVAGADSSISYDPSVYIVGVKIEDGAAVIDSFTKDGKTVDDKVAAFINSCSTSVTITKEVTGNMGDRSKEFTFEAYLTKGTADIDFPAAEDGDKYTVDGTVATFALAHGESITIDDIPIGATLVVTEKPEGYVVYINDTNRENNPDDDGAIEHEVKAGDNEILYTNYKEADIDTAVHLDYLPYIILFAIVGTGVIIAASDKRREADE